MLNICPNVERLRGFRLLPPDYCLHDLFPGYSFPDYCLPDYCPQTLPPEHCLPGYCLPDSCLPDYCLPDYCFPDDCFPDPRPSVLTGQGCAQIQFSLPEASQIMDE